MRPEIALWGWGEVRRNGVVLTRSAPVHVMVATTGAMPGVMLEVNSEDKGLVGDPEGYLTVMWHQVGQIATPKGDRMLREGIGWVSLGAITLFFGLLALREGRRRRPAE